MLQHLLIRNIAIADNIDIDWHSGMTSISGETGAGKSILLNSLNLALGDRADSGIVRHGEKRAQVVATFDVSRIASAEKWLKARDLDNGNECILRRTISSEGRSRAFINGQPVPLSELKTLGEYLIDIHSQHAHQSLMRLETHLRLIDEYALVCPLKTQVKEAWLSWQGVERKYLQLKENAEEQQAKKQLLQYQCSELDELDLQDQEVDDLESEFKRMTHSEVLISGTHRALEHLDSDSEQTAQAILKAALHQLKNLNDDSDILISATTLLESSLIQVEESINDLRTYLDSFTFDDERHYQVEERLNSIHSLARKHKVPSNELHNHHQALLAEYNSMEKDENSLETLEVDLNQRKEKYLKLAMKLSKLRKSKAKAFEAEVIEKLGQLAMPGAKFKALFADRPNHSHTGIDQVEFQISLNPGQPLQALGKVASGGELSRVSLAIQVVCAEHSTIPTLVFDEVDVGVSGATAEIVGHMLRRVGEQGQVICVTHLPQVAALGHHHCIVEKNQQINSTTTNIAQLDSHQRIGEIARMLGGIDITAQTRAHAEEMLSSHERRH